MGKAVQSYETAFSFLRPRVEGLDGEPGLSSSEQSLLDTLLARSDAEAPNVFTDEEMRAASEALDQHIAAIQRYDVAVPPADIESRRELIALTDKRLYAGVRQRYTAIGERIRKALSAQSGMPVDPGTVSITFSGKSSMPRIAFRFIALGLVGGEALVAVAEEQSISLSQASKALLEYLPESARGRFGKTNDSDPLTLEVDSAGKLFIFVYTNASGNRVLFRGKVEVPNAALKRWLKDLFEPAASPPAQEPPPSHCPQGPQDGKTIPI